MKKRTEKMENYYHIAHRIVTTKDFVAVSKVFGQNQVLNKQIYLGLD